MNKCIVLAGGIAFWTYSAVFSAPYVQLCVRAARAPEPFVMMRMSRGPRGKPEKMRQVIAVNAAHPGSADALPISW